MGKPYRECPFCGAHLDAGEMCDCRKPKREPAAAEEKPRKMRLVAICREVNAETGNVAVYQVCEEMTDETVSFLQIWARNNPGFRYFTLTSTRWERFGAVITAILKRRTVTAADVDRIGGIVELRG